MYWTFEDVVSSQWGLTFWRQGRCCCTLQKKLVTVWFHHSTMVNIFLASENSLLIISIQRKKKWINNQMNNRIKTMTNKESFISLHLISIHTRYSIYCWWWWPRSPTIISVLTIVIAVIRLATKLVVITNTCSINWMILSILPLLVMAVTTTTLKAGLVMLW